MHYMIICKHATIFSVILFQTHYTDIYIYILCIAKSMIFIPNCHWESYQIDLVWFLILHDFITYHWYELLEVCNAFYLVCNPYSNFNSVAFTLIHMRSMYEHAWYEEIIQINRLSNKSSRLDLCISYFRIPLMYNHN